MAENQTTPELTPAGPLTGEEIVHVVQAGNSRRTTTAEISRVGFPDYVSGLILSNNAGDPNNRIDISAGSARGNGNSVTNGSVMVKRLDAAWASGTGNGGLDTGSKASGATYHVHAIVNNTTGAFDALFSASVVSPTVPSGWTRVQRLGSVVTDGSGNIRPGTWEGKKFLLTTMVNDISDNALGATSKPYPLTVPNGIKVDALLRVSIFDTAFAAILVTSPDEAAVAAAAAGPNTLTNSGTTNGRGGAALQVRTDTNRQIRVVGVGTAMPIDDFKGFTYGWVDNSLQRI